MKYSLIFRHSWSTGLHWGIIGGIAMVLLLNFPVKIAETLQMATYLLCLIASVLTLKVSSKNNKYLKLFIAAFITSILMFVVPHIYVSIRDAQDFLWKYFFIFTLIAALSCMLLTFLLRIVAIR
jgi:hypothetical protein